MCLPLPDAAVCVHHPTKRAVVICEGSGSYICSLCAIDLDGKTYSAQYLEKAGKKTLGSAFVRYLERPDRSLSVAIVVTFLIFYIAVLTVPLAYYYFAKVVRLRRTNRLYRRVVGRGQVAAMAIILVLFSPPGARKNRPPDSRRSHGRGSPRGARILIRV